MLPTCRVHCAVFDNDGSPVAGAVVTAKLDRFEVYQGYVVPDIEAATTDETGACTLALWPNALGATASSYAVKIVAPNGRTQRLTVTVPDVADANLHEIANLPAYEGKPDGQLIIDAAVAAVAPAVAAKMAAEAARDSASGHRLNAQLAQEAAQDAEAAAEAARDAAQISAGQSAASAADAAQSSTAAAGSATSAASSASVANARATAAEAAASSAATSATQASEHADIAVTKAGEAAISATDAQTAATAAQGAQSAAETARTQAQSAAVDAAQAALTANGHADAAAADAAATAADRVQTGADRVQTGLDRTATAADRVQTGIDRAAVEGIYDQFDDRYLGPKAAEPTLDNDGHALITGALYYNTASLEMRVFNGTVWETAYVPSSGVMPLIFAPSEVQVDNTIFSGNLVLTPGTLDIPSGVTITVEAEAQWIITGAGRALLQYDSASGGWSAVGAPAGEIVGASDTQTLSNKTFDKPVINDPLITGGRIFNAEIVLQAAVWHSHSVEGEATIPEGCNAVSIPPVLIPSGAAVNVGAGSTWSFLSI